MAARSMAPASPWAAPHRGAGPAQVSTSDVLWMRKSASTTDECSAGPVRRVTRGASDPLLAFAVGVVVLGDLIAVARTMEEDFVVALACFLLAHVVERIAQGLNGRLNRN